MLSPKIPEDIHSSGILCTIKVQVTGIGMILENLHLFYCINENGRIIAAYMA